MSILRSLAPFILYAVLAPLTSPSGAAVAALALAVVLLAVARRRGVSVDRLVIEVSSLTFFAVYAVVLLLYPHSDTERWTGAAIQLWLGITVIATVVVHKPFTLPIARTRAPQHLWATPEFLHFNMIISSAWAASFIVSAAIVGGLAALGNAPTLAVIAIMVLAIVVPVLYTNVRVKRMRAVTGTDGMQA